MLSKPDKRDPAHVKRLKKLKEQLEEAGIPETKAEKSPWKTVRMTTQNLKDLMSELESEEE